MFNHVRKTLKYVDCLWNSDAFGISIHLSPDRCFNMFLSITYWFCAFVTNSYDDGDSLTSRTKHKYSYLKLMNIFYDILWIDGLGWLFLGFFRWISNQSYKILILFELKDYDKRPFKSQYNNSTLIKYSGTNLTKTLYKVLIFYYWTKTCLFHLLLSIDCVSK